MAHFQCLSIKGKRESPREGVRCTEAVTKNLTREVDGGILKIHEVII